MPPDYLLPLRWDDDRGLAELTDYLSWLAGHANVVVVDASPPPSFDRHARHWIGIARHVPVAADLIFRNGKVNGVLTGLRYVTAEYVVIADDDVRYDERSLAAVTELLTDADLVLPQNYFDPLPWHARWDTGRILLNRALGHDFPGTLAVRRAALADGYSGDVLFENLELLRTVRAAGGVVRVADHVMVRRIPPTTPVFWAQRLRQAYDSLAQPVRLAAELAVAPIALMTLRGHRADVLLAGMVSVVAVAEAGRRRAGGAAVFPRTAALWAPVWLAERAVCSWLAVAVCVTAGGVRYAGGRIRTAAHSTRSLRARRARFGRETPAQDDSFDPVWVVDRPMTHDRRGPVTVTPYPDGPLLIRGDFELRRPDGTMVDIDQATVALCRCGRSATKPFCDGTHKVTGFRTPAEHPAADRQPGTPM